MSHRSSGALPAVLFAAGWSLLALSVVPDLRDRAALALLASVPISPREMVPPDLAGRATAAFALALPALAIALSARRIAGARVESWPRARVVFSLAAIGALAGLPMLAPGEPTIMDAKSHVARGWYFAECFRNGVLPTWTDLWYTGLPADSHYPPLSHFIAGVLGLLGLDAFTAVKVTAWLCVVAATSGFGILGAELHGSRRSGWLLALAGGLFPATHASWMWEGRLPALLVWAVLPWTLLAVERLVSGRGGSRASASLGWSILALVLAHVGQARVALQIVLVYALVRAIAVASVGATPDRRADQREAQRDERRERRARELTGLRPRLLYLAIGFLLGLALSACASIPMLQEATWVNQIEAPKLLSPKVPSAREIAAVFAWNPRGVGYAGLSIGVLAALGIAGAWRKRASPPGAIGPRAMLVLVCLPWFLVEPHGRGLDLAFVGGMLAAGSVGSAFGRPVWLAASLLLLVDLAPLQLQSTYSAHRGERNRAYDWLEQNLEHGRLLEIPADASGRIRPGHWYFAPARALPTLGGPFIQGAPRAFRFAAAAIDTAGFALRDHQALSPELQRLLAYHGVEAVLVMGPRGPLPMTSPRDEEAPPALWIRDASLLHTLPTAVNIDPPPLPEEPIVSRGLPIESARASARAQLAWLAETAPSAVAARASFSPGVLVLNAIDHTGGPTRLARADYPGTRVVVDGQVIPWQSGPLGGIRVDLPPGWRELRVTTPLSPSRRAMLYTLTVILLGSVLLWARAGFSRPTRRPASGPARGDS